MSAGIAGECGEEGIFEGLATIRPVELCEACKRQYD